MNKNVYKGFEPMQDRVLVQLHAVKEMTDGGIIIPESMREQERIPGGIIRAVGPKVESLDPGDVVLYGMHAGFTVIVDNEPMLLVREADIFARTGLDINAVADAIQENAPQEITN